MQIKLPGHGPLVDDNGNTLGRVTNLVIEGVTATAAHDHLADTFPEELVEVSLYDQATELLVQAERDRQARLPDTFPEDLGNRRFAELINRNAVYGKMAGKQRVSITALPSGGMMVNGSTDALREYITRDIEFTEHMKKRAEIDHIITEALFMQARGRSAPLPRPTMIAMCVRAVCDDIESWSQP